MIPILIHKIVIIYINTIGILLAFWVYLLNRKEKVNKLFFLLTIYSVLWINLSFVKFSIPFLFPETGSSGLVNLIALWASRFAYIFFATFLLISYFFSLYFPREGNRNYLQEKIFTATWLALIALSSTPLMVGAVDAGGLVKYGPLYILMILAAAVSVFLILYNFFRKYHFLSQEDKVRAQYFLVGVVLFALSNIASAAVSFLTGGLLKDDGLPLLGEYSIILFFGFTAYALIKRELFELRIVLAQLLIGLIVVVLLIASFLINILWLKIFLFIVFVLSCIIGYLLIKSTLGETRQKESLEQKVQERTKALEDAKKSLEEAKTVLEIRVRARTRELEELSQSLERQVGERTKELRENLDELERFQKLTVERELKMIGLKEEIDSIKKELGKCKNKSNG